MRYRHEFEFDPSGAFKMCLRCGRHNPVGEFCPPLHAKANTPAVWVIADTHFGHRALVERMAARPEGYELAILRALVDRVKPGDLLIHLGDFCIGQDALWADLYARCTEGVTRVLVRGNHDGQSNAWYRDRGFDFVCRSFVDRYFGKKVVFSHRPLLGALLEFDGGMLNVHGHTHGNDHRDVEMGEHPRIAGTHVEVACETLGYGPVRLEHLLNGKLKGVDGVIDGWNKQAEDLISGNA